MWRGDVDEVCLCCLISYYSRAWSRAHDVQKPLGLLVAVYVRDGVRCTAIGWTQHAWSLHDGMAPVRACRDSSRDVDDCGKTEPVHVAPSCCDWTRPERKRNDGMQAAADCAITRLRTHKLACPRIRWINWTCVLNYRGHHIIVLLHLIASYIAALARKTGCLGATTATSRQLKCRYHPRTPFLQRWAAGRIGFPTIGAVKTRLPAGSQGTAKFVPLVQITNRRNHKKPRALSEWKENQKMFPETWPWR
jgi:hypothetical protein